MDKVSVTIDKITIPTYSEPDCQELPMFAENRVHQRTSGRPYPNKVVTEVNRSEKTDREYTIVTLENKYIKVEILPEIGGRIYSAFDKTTGYDFFYKQHVIKPALIGVLGSWISGGVEFNFPFHHRASGFMPCDFTVETLPDGSGVCHLSEHDPIDRIKGMVSIILRPDEKIFETRMRIYNRNPEEKSFLWWENAAVSVNESYRIFFPPDVTYVNFHYLKSRTTYPVTENDVFNGIPIKEKTDISWHKNTRNATSYFACASQFDFFGGYDYSKDCGVVHVGNHHISPGKKMFTWAYSQLAESWEKALTDTDGQYAELMAGSYSDNQPNFAWLAPYETKEFSQLWYPISGISAPTFANENCAFSLLRDEGILKLQTTKKYSDLSVRISDGNSVYQEDKINITPDIFFSCNISDFTGNITVTICDGNMVIAKYTESEYDNLNMPDVISDMPCASKMSDADELYLAGVHVSQYRDPAVMPVAYWEQALCRKPDHIPSLIAMAKYSLSCYEINDAESYITAAISALNRFNERHQSGEAYYTYGRILQAKGDFARAYDMYYKAYWAADSVARAMTNISVIDIRRKEYSLAAEHAKNALAYGTNNNLATACLIISLKELGENADEIINTQLSKDKLDHMTRFLSGCPDFYSILDSDPVQTCLDLTFELSAMGRYEDIIRLLEGLEKSRPDCRIKPLYYTLAYYKKLTGKSCEDEYAKADLAELGKCYPSRFEEIPVLESADGSYPRMLLGCLYYNKRQYEKAAALWKSCPDCYIARRNLAVAYFSHLERENEALQIMKELVSEFPDNKQLIYETVVLMDKMSIAAEEKISLIKSGKHTRDDILTELSKAYNQASMHDKALETLLSHNFVPCEGGEHAIAEQYMYAYLAKGKAELDKGNFAEALEFFKAGQLLPGSLGAGIWNHCKLIPLRYHQALCLDKLGRKDEAEEIFRYIADVKIEYFSNMHLKELPYWQAKSLQQLGHYQLAQRIMTKYKREWSEIANTTDNGFFSTTPFFISFTDQPAKLRKALYLYLSALCSAFEGKSEASDYMQKSKELNSDNLYAHFFSNFGF